MTTIARFTTAQATSKRDVQAMTAAITDRDAEAPMRALFREDRYGLFEYAGTAVTLRDGSRVLAARAFDTGQGKPTSSLRALDVLDAIDGADGDAVDATELVHGDLATALLQHSLYGEFRVTGVALQNPEGTRTLLGEWLVADAGAALDAVVEVHRIATATEHDVAVPPRLARVETDVV